MMLRVILLMLLCVCPVWAQSPAFSLRYPDGKSEKNLSMAQAEASVVAWLRGNAQGKLSLMDAGSTSEAMTFTRDKSAITMTLGPEKQTTNAAAAEVAVSRVFGRMRLALCQDNLKDIAGRLESYWQKKKSYPSALTQIGSLPHCPTTGKETYSSGYTTDGKNQFRVTCQGKHTPAGIPVGYPFFDWKRGLVVEPGREFPNKAPRH